MIVCNFFAPPGSGKTTTSSKVFARLKDYGINAELAGEYAKDLVWSKRFHTLQDQFYVFGKQHHRVFRLKDEVDVVVCDSPILLALAYCEGYPQCFKDTIAWAFNQYNNVNFYVNRVKPYNPKGRNQTEEESDLLGPKILSILDDNKINYNTINGDDEGSDLVTNHILNMLKIIESNQK